MADKPVVWLGSSLDALRAFPYEAKRRAGYELRRVQAGLVPSSWRPMPSVGPGVVEIRIATNQEHRIFYVAKFAEAVYVLHAFEKRTRKTAGADIDLGARRFAELVRHRLRAKES